MASPDLISSLPDEILAHIFLCTRSVDFILGKLNGTPPTIWMGWLRITFVCARWRRIAVEEARLWSEPNFRLGPKWRNEFIRRSKGALLDVNYDSTQRNDTVSQNEFADFVRS